MIESILHDEAMYALMQIFLSIASGPLGIALSLSAGGISVATSIVKQSFFSLMVGVSFVIFTLFGPSCLKQYYADTKANASPVEVSAVYEESIQ